jgi:glycosyltransferase involved in cell wall biosynthesis
MKTTISVIITTYNRYSFVQKALQSVMLQTRKPDEIIVIDDASTDETSSFFAQHPEVIYQRNENNLGVSASRNRGLQAARGEWICFLDSDDQWYPQKLEKQLHALSLNREYLIAHTNEIWIRRGRRVNQGKRHEKYGGWIFEKCLPLCVISPSSVMIHKTIFQSIGNFDLELPACEDYDLWLRICLKHPVLFLDEPLVLKTGGHPDQLSHKYFGMDRFRIRALENLLINPSLGDEKRQAVILEIEKKARVYAQGCLKREKLEEHDYYQKLLERLKNENRVAVS